MDFVKFMELISSINSLDIHPMGLLCWRTDRNAWIVEMLTNKGKYGLKAMVHLAGLEPGGARPGRRRRRDQLDQKEIFRPHSDRVAPCGLVYSRKGKGGGYALARPTPEIRVGAIVRVLDGPLAPISCASVTAFRPCGDCDDLTTCPVRLIMVEARNAIADRRQSHPGRYAHPGRSGRSG